MDLLLAVWMSGVAVGIFVSLGVCWLVLRKRHLKTGPGVFTIPKGVDQVRVSMRGGGGGGGSRSSGMDIDMRAAKK